MNATLFGLIGGAAFVVLGRRLYSDPWFLTKTLLHYVNFDRPFLKFWNRMTAVMFIFIGSYMVAAAGTSLVIRRVAAVEILGLTSAILGCWFLRPQSK